MLRTAIVFLAVLIFTTVLFPAEKLSDYSVPGWAKQVVWYQIFPERFRNGDPANDPTLGDIKGAWPHDTMSAWQLSPWTSDWYKLQPWEKKNGKGFYYNAQRRRYGGDLQGVLDKLDYLQNLGVTAIYFNPLFESPSLHKYDASTYHHIDDNFGPNPVLDKRIVAGEVPDDPGTWKWTSADSLFFKLIKECHKRGMRVIIDGVWNHVGTTFWAFQDVVRNQQKSPFKDWFIITSWDNPATPENEFNYKGWMGVRDLPEFRENQGGFYPPVWAYMKHAIRKWMDPNGDGDPSDGIDGWRLDVAEQVGFPAWHKFRRYVRSINPEAYLSGEVWWEKWPTKMFDATPWLQSDVFDAVMNYRFARNATRFFINRKKKISVSQFDSIFAQMRKEYPEESQYVLQNLMDSHDTDRLASMIINPDRIYGYKNRLQDNPNYNIRKPKAQERRVQKLIVLFQMTYVGAPMIYYGDEAGMWGASDPDDRKPMLWPDMQYKDEACQPFGKKRPVDKNKFDRALFNYYRKLIHIRMNHPALMLGSFKALLIDDRKDVYAFKRSYQKEEIIVVLNNSDQIQPVMLKAEGTEWVDLVKNRTYSSAGNLLKLQLAKKSGLILQQKR